MLQTRYCAFRGHMDVHHTHRFAYQQLPISWQESHVPFPLPSEHDGACLQWIADRLSPSMPAFHQTPLLLAGRFVSKQEPTVLDQVVRLLLHRDYQHLALPGDVAGVVCAPQRLVFFKSQTSNQSIFWRRQGTGVLWSTDPREVRGTTHLDHHALLACCQAQDGWLYPDVDWVPAGSVVEVTPTGKTVTPLSMMEDVMRPAASSLHLWARLVYEHLLAVMAPLAHTGHTIGILLSGGIDSAALAAALVNQGGNVVAYHLRLPHPAAYEEEYAQAVCTALGISLHCIAATRCQHDHFASWRPLHPYGHPGFAWFAQIAQQMQQDGVRLLVTGRYGDATFGPLERYRLYDILTSTLALREKWLGALHTLSTDWTLPDILQSAWPHGHSLITTATLTAREHQHQPLRRADFLCPSPAATDVLTYSDFAGERTIDFSPQDLVVEQLWRQHGITAVHPYADRRLQTLVSALPAPYRLFPYQGHKIAKPVLRLAFAHCLPASVITRNRGTWTSTPLQSYCLASTQWLLDYLGDPASQVIQRGIVDRHRLAQVLQDPRATRANAYTLIATCMVEHYLQTGNEGKCI